jgi:hypothetical protein
VAPARARDRSGRSDALRRVAAVIVVCGWLPQALQPAVGFEQCLRGAAGEYLAAKSAELVGNFRAGTYCANYTTNTDCHGFVWNPLPSACTSNPFPGA